MKEMSLCPKKQKTAQEPATVLSGLIKPKLQAGKSLRTNTAKLKAENVPTAPGGQWHLNSVKLLVDRIVA